MAKRELSCLALLLGCVLSACAGHSGGSSTQPEATAGELSCPAQAPRVADAQAVVGKYCVTCHSPSGQASEYDFRSAAAITAHRRNIEAKLRLGAMPPPGVPKPNEAERSALWCWAKTGDAPSEYSHAE